jgi:hypothetical protein
MIDLHLDVTQVTVGDEISGRFIWQPDDPSKLPKSAQVGLVWLTEGRGTRDRQVVERLQIDPERLTQLQQRPFPFSLKMPLDAPLTYDGYLFRLMWELEVEIIFPGIFRPKETEVRAIQVFPPR